MLKLNLLTMLNSQFDPVYTARGSEEERSAPTFRFSSKFISSNYFYIGHHVVVVHILMHAYNFGSHGLVL